MELKMNERIRELAQQAGYKDFDYAIIAHKFADLIIRECADVCLDPNHWYEDAAGEKYSKVIKEHFGIVK
jgi:hypothetical protein